MSSETVALVGVGAMGKMLLKRLRAAGQRVNAYDISEAGRTAAYEGGAELVSSSADAARDASFIHIMVADDDQTGAAIAGPMGVLATANEGALLFLHGTVLPSTVTRMAAAADKKGVRLIEAPIVGVPTDVDIGEARFLVGCPETVVDHARRQLLRLGKSVDHFGGYGTASLVKIARAMLNATERAALNEAVQLISIGGIDVHHFLNFERSYFSERCVVGADKMFDVSNNQARMRRYTNLFRKDVFLAAHLAHDYELFVPIMDGTVGAAERLMQLWDSDAA